MAIQLAVTGSWLLDTNSRQANNHADPDGLPSPGSHQRPY
jgi:hypothetical protein